MKPNEDSPAADETTTRVRLPDTVKVDKTVSLPGIGFCVTPDENPSTILLGMSDFAIHRLDFDAEKPEAQPISEARHQSYVTGIVRSGKTAVSGGYDGALIWWNLETGEIIRQVDAAHAKWIRMLALSPDGTRVASVADDMRTKLWDIESGQLIADWGDYEPKTPHGYPSMLYAVAFSPDGHWLATGDKTGQVLVRDPADGTVAARLETPVMYTWDPKARNHSIGGIRSLAFSADAKTLAIGGMGKVGNIDHLEGVSRIEIFEWESQSKLHEIEDPKYKGLVEALRFGPGDQWLVAAGGDHGGFVSVYNVADGKLAAQEKVGNHVHDFTLAPDGESLITVGHHQAVRVLL
jgi:WD40 repeat protein